MNETPQKSDSALDREIEQRLLPWRFWLSLLLTAFLIVTFGLYLPLRFRHQSGTPVAGDHMMAETRKDHRGQTAYHEENEVREGLVVNMNVTPAPTVTGETARLDFFVNEKPENASVAVSELEVDHERLMHVVGARDDLNEFFHIHPQPEVAPGVLSVEHVFRKPGVYKLWSEVVKSGVHHRFGHPEIRVSGVGEPGEKKISFGRSMIVEDYQVVLAYDEPVVNGKETELHFDIHDLFGREVEMGPFLGAAMHLVMIKEDLKQFIHTHPVVKVGQSAKHSSGIPPAAGWSNFYYRAHPESESGENHAGIRFEFVPAASAHGIKEEAPMSGSEDEEIHFAVTFPEAGLYKVFAQFRPQEMFFSSEEEALTAAFWVRAEERSSAVPQNILYALISIAGIVILGWGVKRYLKSGE